MAEPTILTVSKRPSKHTRQVIADLDGDLKQLRHPSVARVSDIAEKKDIATLVRSILTRPGERTIALLDPHGLSASDELGAALHAERSTTLLSVSTQSLSWNAHSAVRHVAFQGELRSLLDHIEDTPLLAGSVDMVIAYHSGIDGEHESLRLASHLLSPQGCFLENFIPPDNGGVGRVVTYYNQEEVAELVGASRSRFDKVISSLRKKASQATGLTRESLVSWNFFGKKEVPS